MRTKRKYDLDKMVREAEEDEKLALKSRDVKQLAQADIQKMIDQKRGKKRD